MLFQALCSSIAGTRPTANASTDSPLCQRRAAKPMISPVVPVKMAWANGDMTPRRKNTTANSVPGSVDLGDRAAEVEDVLGEREAGRDGEGEHHPVDRPVEVFPGEEQEQQQPQGLGEFLHHRRLDGHGERRVVQSRGGPRHGGEVGLQEHGHGNRDDRSPDEGEQQQRPGLGLPAVDEAHGQQHRPQGNERGDEADDEAGDSPCCPGGTAGPGRG